MSCPCTGEFANVYLTINNLEGNFNAITGNTLSNYNQLSRIVSQQANIYNTIYYGTGNLTTGNLSVTSNVLINGTLNVDNGLVWTNPINNRVGILNTNPQYELDVKGFANISSSLYAIGLASFGGQSPFKIDYGQITTNASGNGVFTFNLTYNSAPFVFVTVLANSAFQRTAHVQTVSTTSASIKTFTDNGGAGLTAGALTVSILVIGV